MAARGKNINLYLMDGEPNGRIKCTLANWTGVVYKIPRTEIERCREREDLKQSGVYFLFGTSEQNDKNMVYVGQAGARKNGEGILYRLQEHKRNPEKDYWTEAVVFTTSNNSFGPTEISYLENRFCAIASEAQRYIVKNNNEPSPGHITEEKESELEEFIEYAKIIMAALGFKVFVPYAESITNVNVAVDTVTDEGIFYLKRKSRKSGKTIEATCKQTAEGFVVLQGSHIETIDSESIPASVSEARKKAKIDNEGILQENVLFQSPSYAAVFVIGGHVNGRAEWKNIDGKSLNEIEQTE